MPDQAIVESIINSLVERNRQSLVAKGMELQENWVELQKSIWHNALKASQCTLQELQHMVFSK